MINLLAAGKSSSSQTDEVISSSLKCLVRNSGALLRMWGA